MPLPARTPDRNTEYPTQPPGTALPGLRVDLGDIPFGLVDDDGVEWYIGVDGLAGWWDSPAVVGATTKRPDDHGVWSGPTTLDVRTITIDCLLVAPDTATRDRALARLYGAVGFAATTRLRVAGTPDTQTLVRRSGELVAVLVDDWAYEVTVPLLAPDPRRYATSVPELTTSLPRAEGGLAPPLTPPLALPARPGGGYIAYANDGNLDAPWIARITGPIAGPRLTYANADRFIGFDLELGAGDTLTVDSLHRTAVLNKQASRTGSIIAGSSWWLLAAGQPFDVRFSGAPTSSDTDPQLTFTPLICWS